MATVIEIFRNGAWEAIDYSEFEIKVGLSPRMVAPTASVATHARVSITAGQSMRITIDGTVRFQGTTRSGGSKSSNGQQTVELRHPVAELWEASVSLTEGDADNPPTDEQVLSAAISAAGTDVATSDLSYTGTAVTLNDPYEVQNRSVKDVFRDMMDRTGRVWWVAPSTGTINVQPRGYRGSFGSFTVGQDRGVRIKSFDSGSIDTVRNDITVTGTGDEAIEGTATDQTSIDTYGRRERAYNVSYPISADEANALAQSLLQPDPLAEGEVELSQSTGQVDAPLVNEVLSVDDPGMDVQATGVLIEQQTIEQGRATVAIGGGTGESVREANRRRKSTDDNSRPGSVYNTDRIAANAITANEVDVLDLNANQFSVSDDPQNPSYGFRSSFETNPDIVSLRPINDSWADLGTPSERWAFVYTKNLRTVEGLNVGQPGQASLANGTAAFNPDSADTTVFIAEDAGTVSIYPISDNTGTVGHSGNAFSAIYAYDYINAGDGSSLTTTLDDHETRISDNETTLADHEQRITDLENQ